MSSDMTSMGANASFPQARMAAGRFGAVFRHVGETGSTNTDLADEARSGETGTAVLVADHQTAGRGRRDRVWSDSAGGQLLVSLRLSVGAASPTEVGAAFAVAAQRTLESVGVNARIKWPNDLGMVRVDGTFAKLAGHLGEYVGGIAPVVIVGMGLNVSDAPVPGSTCVFDEVPHPEMAPDRDAVLTGVLDRLPVLLRSPEEVRSALRDRSATIGTRVRVERARGAVVGTAVGLDELGRLLLDDGREVHVIAAGDVIHLRSTDR